MMVVAWIIAIGAWLVILLSPVALVALAVVSRLRRWWVRPLLRRFTGRQPDRVARTIAGLEQELVAPSAIIPVHGNLTRTEADILRRRFEAAQAQGGRWALHMPPDYPPWPDEPRLDSAPAGVQPHPGGDSTQTCRNRKGS